jgi:hypothetical protein
VPNALAHFASSTQASHPESRASACRLHIKHCYTCLRIRSMPMNLGLNAETAFRRPRGLRI